MVVFKLIWIKFLLNIWGIFIVEWPILNHHAVPFTSDSGHNKLYKWLSTFPNDVALNRVTLKWRERNVLYSKWIYSKWASKAIDQPLWHRICAFIYIYKNVFFTLGSSTEFWRIRWKKPNNWFPILYLIECTLWENSPPEDHFILYSHVSL